MSYHRHNQSNGYGNSSNVYSSGGGGGAYSYGGGGGGYGAPPPNQYGGGGGPGRGGGGGGRPYGSPSYAVQPGGPPPGADPQLWNWFIAVDSDRSGAISADELQRALVNGNWSPFDIDTCKMLMGIFDTDRSGTISFTEFAGLWKYIQDWQNVFQHFDSDRSGSIDGQELRNALAQFGYNLTPPLLSLLEQKYASLPATIPYYGGRAPPAPGITFDRFVRACVLVKTLTETFQSMDPRGSGVITVSYEQFMTAVLGAP